MTGSMQLLAGDEAPTVANVNPEGAGDVLLVCEHASLTLPRALGTLGLGPEALVAHIAWDPGALAVARLMSRSLDAHLIHQNYSRLAYDCNRPPESDDAMPALSEIYKIPGNQDIPTDERDARIAEIYTPFKAALEKTIAARKAAGRKTVLVTVHSFTPIYKGNHRSVEIGILHDSDSRIADIMLEEGGRRGGYDIRRNEPYGPADGVTHTLKLHGLENGLANVMIEVRNDLIANEAGQEVVASFLVDLLKPALKNVQTS